MYKCRLAEDFYANISQSGGGTNPAKWTLIGRALTAASVIVTLGGQIKRRRESIVRKSPKKTFHLTLPTAGRPAPPALALSRKFILRTAISKRQR